MKLFKTSVFLYIAISGALLTAPKAEANLLGSFGCFYHDVLFAIVTEDQECPSSPPNVPKNLPDNHSCIERRPLHF